jgi:2-polyprenyl-3-methyl-5-hydroxy-6-metoxy-1,4-benzoquinol methylase
LSAIGPGGSYDEQGLPAYTNPNKIIEGMSALNIESKNFRIKVSLIDILPSLGGKIGLILALDVLEHLDDLGGILYDLGQLLTPGGRILVSEAT